MAQLYLNTSADSRAIQMLLLFTQNDIATHTTQDAPYITTSDGTFTGALTVTRYLLSTFSQSQKSLLREASNDAFYILQNIRIARRELASAVQTNNAAGLKDVLLHFNTILRSSTYVVGNSISIADFFLFAHLHSSIANIASDASNMPVLRWFNLMQFHAPWSNGLKGGIELLKFNYVHVDLAKLQKPFEFKSIVPAPAPAPAPAAKGAADDKKQPAAAADKKADAAKPAAADSKQKAAPAPAADAKKQPEQKAAPAAAAAEVPSVPLTPPTLDIRVGKVVSVEKHPKADRMYVEHIDFGEEKPRVVCSGLVGKIEMSELKDRVLLAVCNLKPANLKGIDSQAMVLVASENSKYEFPIVPQGAKIGERVQYDGHTGVEPPKELVKEHLAQLLPQLKTNEKGELTCFGVVAKVSTGAAVTANFKNAPVS